MPGLPFPYDQYGVIFCVSPGPKKENHCVYSHRADGDISKKPKPALIKEEPIPETFFTMLDILDDVKDTMTCNQVRYPGSSYVRYESAVNLPSNYVGMGDSVMRVNPVYGHLGAVCLQKLLMNSTVIPRDFSKKYFSVHAEKIKPICDYSFSTTIPLPGETLSKGSWLRWYMKKLTIVAFTVSGFRIWHVRSLLAPPSDAFQLGLVLKVCCNLIKG
ncbi:hypothetical protein DFS33DRAFT_1310301 [Desarmillaria ectypa]|nr:hypothetical protein DFS33DRAFT_1310301 [Desarmillaria ectypa]